VSDEDTGRPLWPFEAIVKWTARVYGMRRVDVRSLLLGHVVACNLGLTVNGMVAYKPTTTLRNLVDFAFDLGLRVQPLSLAARPDHDQQPPNEGSAK
jgi:hypothetical protein